MLISKRGVSLIISWVLLLGLAIALGMAIFSWAKIQTEKNVESTLNYVEGSMNCEQVSIGVSIINADPSCSGDKIETIKITNTGKLTIDAVIMRNIDNPDVVDRSSFIEERDTKNFPLVPFEASENIGIWTLIGRVGGVSTGIAKVEFIPLLQEGDERFACTEKKVVVSCE